MKRFGFVLLMIVFSRLVMAQNYSELTKFLNKYIEDHKTPGLQYVLMKNGEVVYEYNGGIVDIAKNTAVSSDHNFRAFSITKTFTALSVMQLVEQGKVSLSDPLSKYAQPYPYKEEINIEQLLSHTAGLSNPLPKWIHFKSEHGTFDSKGFSDSILRKHTKQIYKPGTKAKYSNLDYLWLGFIIEKVSGLSYEQYVKQNITDKLDLPTYAGFEITNETNLIHGHQKANTIMAFIYKKVFGSRLFTDKVNKWYVMGDFYLNGASYGGLIINASGLAKYANSLYFEESNLLGEDMKNIMFTPVKFKNGENAKTKLFNMKAESCIAWFKYNSNNQKTYVHSGGGGGFSNDLRIYPEQGAVSVIMMNKTSVPADLKLLDKVDKYWIE